MRTRRKLTQIFNFFRENNIEPILIKGWATARNFPVECVRLFVDFDLCVEPKIYPTALKLLASNTEIKAAIDLHEGLRAHDTVGWEDLLENSRLVELPSVEVRVLRPEDHLRVICVHWLTDGGAYRERLWDVFYAVANRSADFDWSRFLDLVAAPRRRWLIAVLLLAERYLNLDLANTPLARIERDLPFWMTEEIEREWSGESRLEPLAKVKGDPRAFIRQVGKRLPPNAVHATITCEGNFDESSRLKYQIRNILQRI